MFLRIQMFKIMKALEKDKDFILLKNDLTKYDPRAIYALQSAGAVRVFSGENGIEAIAMVDKGHIYTLARTELWINRIGAFIIGIITGCIIEYVAIHLI